MPPPPPRPAPAAPPTPATPPVPAAPPAPVPVVPPAAPPFAPATPPAPPCAPAAPLAPAAASPPASLPVCWDLPQPIARAITATSRSQRITGVFTSVEWPLRWLIAASFHFAEKKPSRDDRRLAEQAAVADVRLAVHARRGVREPDERIRRHQQVPHDVHAFGREVGGRPIHNVGDTVDDRPAAKFVNARRGGPATDRWIGRYFSTM